MKRGEVYNARLDPTVGSEQSGIRPVVIVSRDAINDHSPVVLAVPCTTFRGQRVFPSQVVVRAGEGGLAVDTVLMAEQVRTLDKARVLTIRGTLTAPVLRQLDLALKIALDLP